MSEVRRKCVFLTPQPIAGNENHVAKTFNHSDMNNNNPSSSNAPEMVAYYALTEAQLESLASRIAGMVADGVKASPVPSHNDPAWISRADTAKMLGVSLQTVASLLKRGALSFKRVNSRVVIDRADLVAKLRAGQLAKYKRYGK